MNFNSLKNQLCYVLVLAGVSLFHSAVSAATLQDFGYRHMTVNGQPSLGHRRLLVILVEFIDHPTNITSFAHQPGAASWYDDYFFNFSRSPVSVNSAFLEMSNGRFFWSRGDTVGPLPLPASQRLGNFNPSVNKPRGLRDQLYYSNIIYQAWASNLFNLASYDLNNDTTVTQDELQIAVVHNDADSTGATRWAGRVQGPDSPVTWEGYVGTFGHLTDFATIVHELSHTLNTIDLYGVWAQESLSEGITLMGATGGDPEVPAFHLDPWHKMQLGWSEPRIYSLAASGITNIAAAQMLDPNAPIILYDPARGTGEFFMLEYRTRTSPRGPGYDANVADTGLALWHVQQNINHQPNLVPRIDAGLLSAQNLWRFCDKCKGLHFISNEDTPSYGRCPAGENHVATSSPGYPAGIVVDYQIVMNNANAPGQHDWRWCSKCQGVFYGPNQASSRCPAIGAHDGSASGNYSFVLNDPIAPGQQNWRWCQKCQGLFYGPNQGTSKCPADGFRHDGSMSANYAMLQAGSNSVVWAEWTGGWSWSPPRYGRGANQLWDAGTITPYLRWVDGSSSCTKIHVHPFNIGDGAITVEWVDEACTWVDFNYFGIFEFGLFEYPYNTLAEGLNAVSWGGTLRIKPGTTPETAHISKAMKIDAYGGTATLGR